MDVIASVFRAFGPKTVLDPARFLGPELHDAGILFDADPRPGLQYDLCIDGGAPAPIPTELVNAVLIAGEDLSSRIESVASEGFAPDTGHSRSGAVLMRRAASAWPPEALRYFVRSLEWRESAAALESERKLNRSLRDIQVQLARDTEDLRKTVESGAGSVDETRLRTMEQALRADIEARFEELMRSRQEGSETQAHLARLDRKVLEISRGMQALSGRIDGIFASRTWQALTAAGGLMLRFTGRKS